MNLETLVRAYGEITPGKAETLDAILDRLPAGIFPESLRQSLAAHCSERKLAPAAFVRSVLKTRILAGLGVAAPVAGDKRINRHQCFSCALKHLASALVIASEIQTGYDTPEYALYLLGNLAEAQEQIACRTPALANRIRKLRLSIFGDGGTPDLTSEALKKMLELADDVRRLAEGRETRRHCGCGRNAAPGR